MVYPILFPNGDQGWHEDLRSKKDSNRNRISLLQYYSNRFAIRNNEFNPLLKAGKLTQQFIVDSYVKIEGNRLNYIKLNQKKLRVEHYKGLMDHVYNKNDDKKIKAGKWLFCHLHSLVVPAQCNSTIKTPWLWLENMANQTYSLR